MWPFIMLTITALLVSTISAVRLVWWGPCSDPLKVALDASNGWRLPVPQKYHLMSHVCTYAASFDIRSHQTSQTCFLPCWSKVTMDEFVRRSPRESTKTGPAMVLYERLRKSLAAALPLLISWVWFAIHRLLTTCSNHTNNYILYSCKNSSIFWFSNNL